MGGTSAPVRKQRRAAVKAVVLFFAALIGGSACARGREATVMPAARKGIIDLRGWNFDDDGPVCLSGEWDFFWEKLFGGEVVPGGDDRPGHIMVPGIWNGRIENGRPLDGDGYATYRLRVLLPAGSWPPAKKRMALALHDMGTAFALFVNGVRAGGGGAVGESPASATPGFRPGVFDCAPDEGNEMDIVLQVSNFHHRKGGAWETIILGRAEALRETREKKLAADFFLFGSIVIMGIYHLVLFFMRRRDRYFFYFGLFCLLIAARILVTGEYFAVRLFPGLSWEWIIGAEYLTFYAATPVFFLFLGSLFPGEFSRRVLALTAAAGGLFCALVIAAPPRLFTHSLQPFQALSVCICLYALAGLARAGLRGREGAVSLIAGFVFLFAAVINDFLQSNMVLGNGYLVPAGLFVFIFSQSFLLSRRYARTAAAVERLTRENDNAKYNLLQKRMSPHFLFNALNTVHALINRDREQADRAVLMLAENYRFLIDHSFLPLVPFDTEWRFVENYLRFEELRFSDAVSAVMERRGDFSRIYIPPFSLQPLVENALKHGMLCRTGQGMVSIAAVTRGGFLSVAVRDNGPGLSPRCDVFSRSLGNIRKRLEHHFADVALDMENAREGGLLVRLSFRHGGNAPAAADRGGGRAYDS